MWQRNELGFIGLMPFFVNCFELFLKENPPSHAVNIWCGFNGLTQECSHMPVLMCFLNLQGKINTPNFKSKM